MELNKAKTQVSEAETAITSQKAQIEKLNHVVQEADAGRCWWLSDCYQCQLAIPRTGP